MAAADEVTITSRETIKPSSPTIHLHPPYKLSYFDQLVPFTYLPLILFYHSLASTTNNSDISQLIDHAKSCLAQALTVYYPLSGRIHNNSFVHRFDAGVPFVVARVSSTLARFLESGNRLNLLLPCRPFSLERPDPQAGAEPACNKAGIPLFTFQISVFACGGVAFGGGLCHKIGDSASAFSFTKTLSAFFRGTPRRISRPDFTRAASLFPPRTPMPQQYVSLIEKMWFSNDSTSTRRFFFSPESIASLRHQVQGSGTSVETLAGFIWKHFIAASRAAWGTTTTPRSSILDLEVNLRKRTSSRTLEPAFGNLFWPATAVAMPEKQGSSTLELPELVKLIGAAVAGFDDGYVKSLQGEEGFRNISRDLDARREMLEAEEPAPDVLTIGSIRDLGLDQIEFGAGGPGMLTTGDVSTKLSNFVILAEAKLGAGIEAWMIIEEKRMGFMELDREFLKYAVPVTSSTKMSKL